MAVFRKASPGVGGGGAERGGGAGERTEEEGGAERETDGRKEGQGERQMGGGRGREWLQDTITEWYSYVSDTTKVTIYTTSISLPLPPPLPLPLPPPPPLDLPASEPTQEEGFTHLERELRWQWPHVH